MHPRDARILALARRLVGPRPSFSGAVGALSAAVTQIIPAGRVFVIGTTPDGPIVGSAISGIGLAPSANHVAIVRVGADGHVLHLDAWLATHELATHEHQPHVSSDLPPRELELTPRAVLTTRHVARAAGLAKPRRSEARDHA
ncbi:MAG: hypothetical protein MUE69_20065 [Myxococcota bacterium]|jgi:hypothetical protein|nr:hypothetical protein [Myxococcota bacterium]